MKPTEAGYVFTAVRLSDKVEDAGQDCKYFVFSQLNNSSQNLIKFSNNYKLDCQMHK